MTETGTEKKSGKPGTVKKKAPARTSQAKLLPWFGVLALALAVVLSAGAYLLWQQVREETSVNAELVSRINQVKAELTSLGARIGRSDQQSRQAIAAHGKQLDRLPLLAQAVSAMQKRLDRDRKGWVLAEANYLVRIAAQRLTLARDVATALRALQSADARLRELNQPELVPIRRQLATDIQALQAIRVPDVNGLVLKLDSAINQVDKLRLRSVQRRIVRKKTAAGKGKEDVLASVWNSLKTLVVIRRHDHKLEPMLSSEQQTSIKRILQLRLEQVRLALLGSQQQQLKSSLARAQAWLKRFYDVSSQPVKGLLGLLDELSKLDLSPELPIPSGSLKLLEKLQKTPSVPVAGAVPSQPAASKSSAKPAPKASTPPANKAGSKGKQP